MSQPSASTVESAGLLHLKSARRTCSIRAVHRRLVLSKRNSSGGRCQHHGCPLSSQGMVPALQLPSSFLGKDASTIAALFLLREGCQHHGCPLPSFQESLSFEQTNKQNPFWLGCSPVVEYLPTLACIMQVWRQSPVT